MNDEAAVRKGGWPAAAMSVVEKTKYFKPIENDWRIIEEVEWAASHWAALGTLKDNGNQPVRASVVWPERNKVQFDILRAGMNKVFRMNGMHYRLQYEGDIKLPTKMIVLHKVVLATIERKRKRKGKKGKKRERDEQEPPWMKKFLDKLEGERRKRARVRNPRRSDYFDIGAVLPDGEVVVRNTVGE